MCEREEEIFLGVFLLFLGLEFKSDALGNLHFVLRPAAAPAMGAGQAGRCFVRGAGLVLFS